MIGDWRAQTRLNGLASHEPTVPPTFQSAGRRLESRRYGFMATGQVQEAQGTFHEPWGNRLQSAWNCSAFRHRTRKSACRLNRNITMSIKIVIIECKRSCISGLEREAAMSLCLTLPATARQSAASYPAGRMRPKDHAVARRLGPVRKLAPRAASTVEQRGRA